MKSQLTALFVAMPLLLVAVQSHAEYVFKFPIEESAGGNLPNGSIIIVKSNAGGVVVPPVVVEPDPLEPEDAKCDPYKSGDPTGKEKIFPAAIGQVGNTYWSCELKKESNSNIRFIDGISVDYNSNTSDTCKTAKFNETDTTKNICRIDSYYMFFEFRIFKDANGNISFMPFSNNVMFYLERNKKAYASADIKGITINGVNCSGYKSNFVQEKCTFEGSYESLAAMVGKPYIVEFRR